MICSKYVKDQNFIKRFLSSPEETCEYNDTSSDHSSDTLDSAQGWSLSYVAGDPSKNMVQAQVISAIQYDRSGDYLAIGNKNGRIMIYQRNGMYTSQENDSSAVKKGYTPYTDFQSHTPEFDYLKSLEIEEKINQIKWCHHSNNAKYLLSTNDKTIKLWKIHDHRIGQVTQYQVFDKEKACTGIMHKPKPASQRKRTTTARRVYANAHTYHINSVALNSDGETFMSVDDLRVNLWNLDISNQSFNIVDIKPKNMEELTEVITAADFHPFHCNIMMYSTSRGAIKLGDMRQAALCDMYSNVYEEQEDPESRNFFSEIIASISDAKFSPDGRYIIARDFLTLKIWDLNMNSKPVQTIYIHENLRSRLGDLYESDCIFDKFECAISEDSQHFVTGSYNSEFHIYDRFSQNDICISPTPQTTQQSRRHSLPHHILAQQRFEARDDVHALDVSRKVLQTTWHPSQNEISIAIRNNVYIYNRKGH